MLCLRASCSLWSLHHMYIRVPLWIKVMRALQVRSHNTYTISQEFNCNKNTASIVLNRLVRTGYAKRDKYNWFSAAKIRIQRMDSDATNSIATNRNQI